jgi:cytochrome P450
VAAPANGPALQPPVGELREDLEHLTAASIARFCLGDEAGDEASGAAQELLDALFPVFASPYRLPALIRRFQPRERRVRRALGEFDAVLGAELAALRDPRCPVARAGSLAAAMREGGLAGDSLLGPVRSLMLAAHDVPASALAWAVVELARSPGMQDFVIGGAASWDGVGTPPREITWFVHEVLRLWPPTWGLSRNVVQDDATVCGDWLIPAGSTIIVPLWVLHRVAASFAEPDPEQFDPGRWASMTPRPGCPTASNAGPCPAPRSS